jgi:hypothetical protein
MNARKAQEATMNLYGENDETPLHDWKNEALERLVFLAGREEGNSPRKQMRDKAIQLLQERGVKIKTTLGHSIFAHA